MDVSVQYKEIINIKLTLAVVMKPSFQGMTVVHLSGTEEGS